MTTDLGLKTGMLTELFTCPVGPEEWLQYTLTEQQLLHYKHQGYLQGVKLLNQNQVESLRIQLEEMANPAHPGREFFYEYHSNESEDPDTTLFHALGAWRVRPAFHDALWNPAFLMAAYQLLGQSFRLFHDQLFSKPARHGGVVAWHQDYSYWTWTAPMAHLTSWIALDDVDTTNGCMYYVPGSHHWGLLEKKNLAGEMDVIRTELTPDQLGDFDRKAPMEMNAGEASFHHPLLMHGSYENQSDRSRRATIINIFADGVISNREENGSNAPGADNYPRIPKGEKMQGTYYPLLLDSEQSFAGIAADIPTINDI